MKVLQPLIDKGDIRLFANVWARDWLPIEAYTHTIEALEAYQGKITAIVASDDGTAGGAIQAWRDHGLAGKVFVSGQDADLAAIIRILDGTQTMTVYKPARAWKLLRRAWQKTNGRSNPPKGIRRGFSGLNLESQFPTEPPKTAGPKTMGRA